MRIQLQYLISTSLRCGSSKFEQGENLNVRITLNEADWSEDVEREIARAVRAVDHRHLTDDFQISNHEELLKSLKDRLRQQGLKDIALELEGLRTFCRWN